MNRFPLILAFSLFEAFALSGCYNYPSSPASGCGTGTALIAVRDGYTENLCGCQEAAGTVAMAGHSLTCTITHGTWVVFDFTSAKLMHQVASTGTPSFPQTPLHDPDQGDRSDNAAVQLTQTGTYTYIDLFTPSVGGQIIVQ
jgi:plastocyanin